MKNILLATTALVMTTGFAAAEVATTGTARMGIKSTDTIASEEFRLRMNLTGSTTTDAGIAFSATTRLNIDETFTTNTDSNSDTSTDDNGFNGARVQAKFGGFTVQMGNASGAAATRVNLYPAIVGLDGWGDFQTAAFSAADGHTEATSSGNGPAQTRVDYDMGDWGVSISKDIDSNTDTEYAASYTMGSVTAAIGFLNADAVDSNATFASVTADVGALNVGVSYIDSEADTGAEGDSAYSVGASYAVSDVLTLNALYASSGDNNGFMDNDVNAVGFQYSMGGSVTLKGGTGTNAAGTNSTTLGVAMSF